MFKKLFTKENSSRNLSLIILLVVFFVVLIRNFPFGSWYTGWDNLHPEFNFLLNFKRALNAVWQSNQGLGTYGGHGYAATIVHTIILFLMSFILPLKYLRSGFTFLTLLIGPLGVFFLMRKMLQNHDESLKNKAAILGSLFYLLNFGTVQTFYIQLEAFIVHFALLPWLFYSLINFLEKKDKKNLLIFTFISIISTIQGFIPPLFIVYLLLLGIFLLFYVLSDLSWPKIKSAILIVGITLAINAFWFLPVVYYSATHSNTYLNAYNNIASTEDFILKNRQYGDLKDVIVLKGFTIDAVDTSKNGDIIPIFANWQKHFATTPAIYIGSLFFLIILLGLFNMIRGEKVYYFYAFFVATIFIFSLLATNTFPFSLFSELMQKLPILKQAFRIAFTKFSISLAFLFAIGFGYGIMTLLDFMTRKTLQNKFSLFITIVLFFSIIYFSLPIFTTGDLLYQRTKLNIPTSYFEMFDFFQKQNAHGKIANFPQGWNWGWSVYKWGYSGSGFLWYGVEQPILDRSFDVWGKQNEDYYWQMNYAIYSKNYDLIPKLLDKYQIRWLVFDKNIIPYPNVKSIIYSDDFENYLDHNNKLSLAKTIKSSQDDVSDIKIYMVNLNKDSNSNQEVIPVANIKNIGPEYDFTQYDRSYDDYGNYITDPNQPINVFYPFRSFITTRSINENIGSIKKNTDSFAISQNVPDQIGNYSLILPKVQNVNEEKIHLVLNQSHIKVSMPLTDKIYNYKSELDPYFLNHQPTACGSYTFSKQDIKQEIVNDNTLRFTSYNSENCYVIDLPNFSQRNGYLIDITNKHIAGKKLQFSLINDQARKSEIEVSLSKSNNFEHDYIVVPPMDYYGIGYKLLFNNISMGNEKSINELKNITVNPIPYQFLTQIKLVNQKPEIQENKNILVYWQSFDKDWIAFNIDRSNSFTKYLPFIFGKKLNNHVMINNWTNGWKLDNNIDQKDIVIIFWPQYLEFLGFGLLLITLIFLLKREYTRLS